MGTTPDGEAYSADDPELLAWVQATAAFGFLEAYRRYARKLTADDIARYYGEGDKAAALYGSTGAPRSEAELRAFFARMAPKLEPSPVIAEFLDIMQTAPILPPAGRPFQRLMVRAGVSAVPDWARQKLLLGAEWDLSRWERRIVKAAAKIANRTALDGSPPVEACLRLGLPAGAGEEEAPAALYVSLQSAHWPETDLPHLLITRSWTEQMDGDENDGSEFGERTGR
jgi:uncharacterized protein (DUF2236 family)